MMTAVEGMRFLGVLLLALAMARAGEDEIDALLEGLRHPNAHRRHAAQAWLAETADLPWDRIVPLLDSYSLEVRRVVRERVTAELRVGTREVRMEILRALESVQAARGLLPALAAMARKADAELAGRAMIAHMRIGRHRDYVADLAASRATWVYLREFDRERDAALRSAAGWHRALADEGETGRATEVKEYLALLAAASPEATTRLMERVQESNGEMLRVWVEIAAHHTLLPAGIGPILAGRLKADEVTQAWSIARSLIAGDPLWGEEAAPVREATLERLARERGAVRSYLLLLLARCGGDDPRVRAMLVREAARNDAGGAVAACLLGGTAHVDRVRAQSAQDRLRILAQVVEIGTAEFIPVIRDRLLHGSLPERRIVSSNLQRIRARHLLLPDFETIMATGDPEHAAIAVEAAARVDPHLDDETTERVLLAGLATDAPRVRTRALYACDELLRFGEKIPAAFARIVDSQEACAATEVANAVGTTLAGLGEKGRHAAAFLPLLTRIVLNGPPHHLVKAGYKSARTLRYDCLAAAVEVDPRAPETRAACRAALLSERWQLGGTGRIALKLKALHGFMQLQDPTPEDRSVVEKARQDKDESVRAYARRLLRRGGWRKRLEAGD